MKKVKKNIQLISFFFSAILLFTSCTQYESDDLDLSKSNYINNYSGEEIFKGIFFLDENFASNIEILNTSILYDEIYKNEYLINNLKDASTLISNEIRKSDPLFFENFEQLIKSKNEFKIKEAIEYGSNKLIEISNLIFEENNIDEQMLTNIITSGDYDKVIDKDGNLDTEKLSTYLNQVDENANLANLNFNQNGKCLCAAIVTVAFFVAAVGVLVAGAIAVIAVINGGVLINLGAVIGVYVEVATPDISKNTTDNLALEMLINQIANL